MPGLGCCTGSHLALQVPIKWHEVEVQPVFVDGVSQIPADSLASIRENTIALKGPLATPSQSHCSGMRSRM